MLILEFVVALAVLIIVHEAGHFLACRLFRVEVEEFGIGIPPRAATLFKAGGTQFTLNWIPFGGFVRPKGENDPTVQGGLAAANPWVRIAVFLAGPLMNLITAVILYTIIISVLGKPDPARLNVVQVQAVVAGSPAEQVGLQVGDILLQIEDTKIESTDAAREIIYANLGKSLHLIYQRGEAIIETDITPRANPPEGEGAVGIVMDTPSVPTSLIEALPRGVEATYQYSRMLLEMLGRLIGGALPAEQGRVVGLKGMFDIYQAVRSEPMGGIPPFIEALGFFASITISLGLFNLLPIPALDGGRITFILPEIILRRRIPQKYETLINGISFLLLILLMILINLQDFINPATLPSR